MGGKIVFWLQLYLTPTSAKGYHCNGESAGVGCSKDVANDRGWLLQIPKESKTESGELLQNAMRLSLICTAEQAWLCHSLLLSYHMVSHNIIL